MQTQQRKSNKACNMNLTSKNIRDIPLWIIALLVHNHTKQMSINIATVTPKPVLWGMAANYVYRSLTKPTFISYRNILGAVSI